MPTATATNNRPRVIVIGGGFGGIAAAKALADAPVDVVLIDRRNHHVFQPLLYQVATAALSPAHIAAPIRAVLRKQQNCEVALAEVTAIDLENRRVLVAGGYLPYDYVVLAAGATHAYFGHDEWADIAPGLKTLEDAIELRKRILLAFESAEFETSEAARRANLTFAIVGGGATGVELAGAIMEIAGQTIPKDYRNIDTRTTRVILFEGGDRLLPPFDARSSQRAQRDLEDMGVEVRLDSKVTNVTDKGIYLGDEFIPIRNVFWAAGVTANPLGRSLASPTDRAGRVVVGSDLSVAGHPEAFVVGDLAAAKSATTGKPVPGVAQGALQMGDFAGRIIADEVSGRSAGKGRPAFAYRDKGSMAVIGNSRAVAELAGLRLGGFIAWVTWAVIHVAFLVNFRNRILVMHSLFWNWLFNARDARLITGAAELVIERPPGPFVPAAPVEARAPKPTTTRG